MSNTFTIVKTRNGKDTEHTATLAEHIKYHSYTLECGASYQHEKGNKKINRSPRNAESLVKNLNNAINNSAANGHSETYYTLKSPTTLIKGAGNCRITLHGQLDASIFIT